MNRRSMMWRTTYGLGALGFGGMLAYMALLLGADAQHGVAFRISTAGALIAVALLCAISAVRELSRETPDGERGSSNELSSGARRVSRR